MDWVGPDSPDSPIPEKSRSEWKVAAETWRLPYWDFALRRSYNQNNACVPEQALIDGDVLSPLATGTAHLPNIPKRDHNPNPLYAFEYPLPKGETPGQHGINEWPYGMPVSSHAIIISQQEARVGLMEDISVHSLEYKAGLLDMLPYTTLQIGHP